MSWVSLMRRRGIEPVEEAELGAKTTYRVGGRARAAIEVRSKEEFSRIAAALGELDEPVPVLVLGNGSNMLVSDRGFEGLVVTLNRRSFGGIEIDEGNAATVGSAVALPVAARRVSSLGLAGLAWGVGIPGSVGGAVRMNAGGHGSSIGEVLKEAFVADLAAGGEVMVRPAGRLHLGYRHSGISATEVVVEATFALTPGDPAELGRLIDEIVSWRREHQPGGQNAGSVFQNPPDTAAAALIEEAGLKGLRYGSAQVSPRHANFIQADSGGQAEDVYALIQVVQAEVAKRFGIELRLEVELVGFSGTRSGEAR